MFRGTEVTLNTYAPTFGEPIITPVSGTISNAIVEFEDVSETDIAGDAYEAVAASLDIKGSKIFYEILPAFWYHRFADVDDDTGFNGYSLTFAALSSGSVRLRGVRVDDGQDDLGLADDALSWSRDTVNMNVDNLFYSLGATVVLQLDFTYIGTGGRDLLEGKAGNDFFRGKRKGDEIFGAAGEDTLRGGGGNDRLDGGRDDDKIFGGSGADEFVLSRKSGHDTIMDFKPGKDVIVIETSAERFRDLKLVEKDNGLHVIDDGARLILRNVDLADVDAGDFLF